MTKKEITRKPTFSIIIPMKNAEEYIFNTLNSIGNQEFEDMEVLIIDDNSDITDNSKDIIEKWKEEHSDFCIKTFETQDETRGPGGARNIGLDNANGRYILFLDADDQLNNNALISIKNAIDNNSNTDIFVLGSQLVRLDLDGNVVGTLNLKAGKLEESRLFQIGVNTAGTIWNICTKKELFDGKNRRDQIRFKTNCVFEDLPTKVQLFTRNKKDIRAVKHMTHTQFSRPCKSITGSLNFKDIKRLIDANKEIANLKSDVDNKDKMYINVRLATLPVILSWFTVKCIRNKIDRLRMKKKERSKIDIEL